MNKKNAIEYVRRYFGFLPENGELKIMPPLEGAEQAAGWIIEVESEAFYIRLVLDRGQVFMEVGSGPDVTKWYDLGLVVSFLTDEKSSFEYSIPEGPITNEVIERQIARGAEVVQDNYAMLAAFFLSDGFEGRVSELVAFQREKSQKRWKRLLR